jgi:hypothetical protein
LCSFVGTNPVFVDRYLVDEISDRIKEGNFDLQLKDERMFNIYGKDFHVQKISIIKDMAHCERPGDIIRAGTRYEFPGHISMFCIDGTDLINLYFLVYKYPTVKIVEVSGDWPSGELQKRKCIQIVKLEHSIKKSYF